MAEIELTQGQRAIVDDADFEWLNRWTWSAWWNPSTNSFYAVRVERRKSVFMHRQILAAAPRAQVDHIHHNTLDNRRSELRLATWSQNQQHSRNRPNQSGLRGVSHVGGRKKPWYARIKFEGKYQNLGYFDTPEAASAVYEARAKELFGEFYEENRAANKVAQALKRAQATQAAFKLSLSFLETITGGKLDGVDLSTFDAESLAEYVHKVHTKEQAA